MARERKRKTAEPVTDARSGELTEVPNHEQVEQHLPDPATEFDPAKLEQPPLAGESPTEAPAKHTARLHGEPKGGVTKEQAQPNPFSADLIVLTEDNDGPKIRFYRERRNPTLRIWEDANAIQFDAKPEEETLQKLRDNGWKYNGQHKVWKKPLGENPASEDYKNHQLFGEIGNGIRAKNGLEPTRGVGNGVA